MTGTFYLVNINLETMYGNITTGWVGPLRQNASGLISITDGSGSFEDGGSFKISPSNFVPFQIRADVTGFAADDYMIDVYVLGKTSNSLLNDDSFQVQLEIIADADPHTTRVENDGSSPTLDEPWTGLAILPYDSDNIRISTYNNEKFDVTIRSGNLSTATCETVWDDVVPAYKCTCKVPNIGIAGDWSLMVKLNEVIIFSSTVHTNCPSGFYECIGGPKCPEEFACLPCPNGAVCDVPGTTLIDLPLRKGFWRIGICMHRSTTVFV